MPCVHPIEAWRNDKGLVTLEFNKGDGAFLQLPCGKCIGCAKSKAQGWALRNLLELQDHKCAAAATLSYNDDALPLTLRPRDLQLFLKRLRKKSTDRIRFFASGEYGEKNERPHYHAILYGLDAHRDRDRINTAWGQGHTYLDTVTPPAIGYIAGYCAKKYNKARSLTHERVDYQTGELYTWQEEFLQMSRKPGIGASARRHTNSWRDYAILNGTRMPVPKYLHEAWKKITTESEKEEHDYEKYLKSLTKERMTKYHLEAQEQILKAQQNITNEKRKL